MRELLREFIKAILAEQTPPGLRMRSTASAHPSVTVGGTGMDYVGEKEDSKEKVPDNLLLEPDDPDQDERPDEASGAAAVAGVTVPLGAGPTYPSRPKKKRRKKNNK